MPDNASIARALYDAFRAMRRDDAENLMAEDFTFTSPYDDAIDRAEFFRRCWPNNELFQSFKIERVSPDADGAFITSAVRKGLGGRTVGALCSAQRWADAKVPSTV